MPSEDSALTSAQPDVLNQILATVQTIQQTQTQLSAAIESVQGQVNVLSGVKQIHDAARGHSALADEDDPSVTSNVANDHRTDEPGVAVEQPVLSRASDLDSSHDKHRDTEVSSSGKRPGATSISRIILTTYPNQSGINPLLLNWGHKDPFQRGPVVVSRNQTTIRRRNGMFFPLINMATLTMLQTAIGAHGGSYSIYHALAVASKNLDVEYKADFTNSEPAVNVGPHP